MVSQELSTNLIADRTASGWNEEAYSAVDTQCRTKSQRPAPTRTSAIDDWKESVVVLCGVHG
jgi:hypothetical protein